MFQFFPASVVRNLGVRWVRGGDADAGVLTAGSPVLQLSVEAETGGPAGAASFAAPARAGLSGLPVELVQNLAGWLPPGDFQALRCSSSHHFACLSDPVVLGAQQRRVECRAARYQQLLRALPVTRPSLPLCIEAVEFMVSAWAFFGRDAESRTLAVELWHETMRVINTVNATALNPPQGSAAEALRLIDVLEVARHAPGFVDTHRSGVLGVYSRSLVRLVWPATPVGERLALLLSFVRRFTRTTGLALFCDLSLLLEMADALPRGEREVVHAGLVGSVDRVLEPLKSFLVRDRAVCLSVIE